MTAVLTGALALARRGVPVFPVNAATKAPRLVAHGVLDATTDARLIEQWFSKLIPDAGVAAATGSRSGIVVVDVDPRHGGHDGMRDASGRLGNLPPTTRVGTPSGGYHLWCRLPEGVEVRNSAGKIAPGVDVRGDGGYVVCPPTRGPRGAWEWIGRRPLAEAPVEWLTAVRPPEKPKRAPAGEWVAALRAIPDGQRNATLARLVGLLLGAGIDRDVVAELALAVSATRCRPPLPPDEVERIVTSIAGRERRKVAKL